MIRIVGQALPDAVIAIVMHSMTYLLVMHSMTYLLVMHSMTYLLGTRYLVRALVAQPVSAALRRNQPWPSAA